MKNQEFLQEVAASNFLRLHCDPQFLPVIKNGLLKFGVQTPSLFSRARYSIPSIHFSQTSNAALCFALYTHTLSLFMKYNYRPFVDKYFALALPSTLAGLYTHWLKIGLRYFWFLSSFSASSTGGVDIIRSIIVYKSSTEPMLEVVTLLIYWSAVLKHLQVPGILCIDARTAQLPPSQNSFSRHLSGHSLWRDALVLNLKSWGGVWMKLRKRHYRVFYAGK